MAWTYSGDPSASDLDAVRFYIGDTTTTRQLLQDAEINFAISEHSNLRLAAAVCADAIAAKFAAESDMRVGDISRSLSQISKAFTALATKLRSEVGKRAAPSFPAASRDWKESQREDIDLVQPAFGLGDTDNPWAVQLNNQLDRAEWYGW
jgi:hypothetical protein